MRSDLPPAARTPLLDLPALALDVETTGLDVRKARVVQIGAVALEGGAVAEAPALDRLVRPDIPIPARATRIHGLDDDRVAAAPPFAEIAGSLREHLRGRVVIGHHVGFDLAVLRFEAARAGLPWEEPPALDIALVAGALDRTLRVPAFEAVMARLGLPLGPRHGALEDCRAAARAWTRLAALLHDAGVRTLGEAQALAGRRQDLLLRQAEDGWHDVPSVRRTPGRLARALRALTARRPLPRPAR